MVENCLKLVSYRIDIKIERRKREVKLHIPSQTFFLSTYSLFNEVLLYPAAFEALTSMLKQKALSVFFPVHCTQTASQSDSPFLPRLK